MADNKKTRGTGFANPVVGEVVPDGYVRKRNKDGTITFVKPKKQKKTDKK